MDLAFVILGVVLILVLYYFLYSDGSTVLSNKLDLAIDQTPVPISSITLPESKRYSIEMWMYVYQFPGVSTYIISREAVAPGLQNLGIKLDGSAPKLSVEYTSGGASKSVVITDNVPLQTWVHLVVSVDNDFVDVYMNGKLVKSFKDSIDVPSTTSPIKYGKLSCYLAKLVRSTNATDPQTAWNLYSAGNGENPLAKYLASFGLSVTLQKNNQDYSKVTLF
jgi:hypothetical protein